MPGFIDILETIQFLINFKATVLKMTSLIKFKVVGFQNYQNVLLRPYISEKETKDGRGEFFFY